LTFLLGKLGGAQSYIINITEVVIEKGSDGTAVGTGAAEGSALGVSVGNAHGSDVG